MVESIPTKSSVNRKVDDIIQAEVALSAFDRLQRSKYGFFEILRAGFVRLDAVRILRSLNRRFNTLS